MNRWGSTQFLHYTNKLGKEELTKQAQFADSAVQKVVSAWITPIDFSELASLMDLLHQRRLTHLQNVEHALTTESDPEALVQALAEERIWIAGYEQLIDFLGQGPDCLIRAHEEQLLIFQGRRYAAILRLSLVWFPNEHPCLPVASTRQYSCGSIAGDRCRWQATSTTPRAKTQRPLSLDISALDR